MNVIQMNSSSEARFHVLWELLIGKASAVQLHSDPIDDCNRSDRYQCNIVASFLTDVGCWRSENLGTNQFAFNDLVEGFAELCENNLKEYNSLNTASFTFKFEGYSGDFLMVNAGGSIFPNDRRLFIFADRVDLTQVIENESKSILDKAKLIMGKKGSKKDNPFQMLSDLKRVTKILEKHLEEKKKDKKKDK